jgi:thioesterase domain-containing protein
MAAYHVEQICAAQSKGPYHIAGYSSGARVALEIAQQLVASGREVGLLGPIDSGPYPWGQNEGSPPSHCGSLTRNLYYWLIDDLLDSNPREMFGRAYGRLKKLAARLRIIPTPPPPPRMLQGLENIHDLEKLPDHLRLVIETNYQAWMSYKPRPYPGRVTLFRARAGSLFPLLEHDLGWCRVAPGRVEILTVRGNHSNIMLDPRVRELASQLGICLEEADQKSLARLRSPCSAIGASGPTEPPFSLS